MCIDLECFRYTWVYSWRYFFVFFDLSSWIYKRAVPHLPAARTTDKRETPRLSVVKGGKSFSLFG